MCAIVGHAVFANGLHFISDEHSLLPHHLIWDTAAISGMTMT